MLLGYFDAAMTKHHRNALQGNAREEQLGGESITETVRVAVKYSGKFEEPVEAVDVGSRNSASNAAIAYFSNRGTKSLDRGLRFSSAMIWPLWQL